MRSALLQNKMFVSSSVAYGQGIRMESGDLDAVPYWHS